MPSRSGSTTKTLKDIDYDQGLLLNKILSYLNIRAAKNTDPSIQYDTHLPFYDAAGICSGLVAYWLYLMRSGKSEKFNDMLLYLATWDDNRFLNNTELVDPIIENFMNDVFFLHHDKKLRGVEKHNIHESINLLVGDDFAQVATAEYSLSFVFDRKALSSFIKNYVRNNKMLRFGNGLHTVGAIMQDGVYYFFDPSDRHGLKDTSKKSFMQMTSDPTKLTGWIFTALAKHCHSKSYIALNLSVFDFKDSPASAYPYPDDYYAVQFKDKKFKKAVLQHPNIMRVGLRYDLSMLDALFAAGYNYVESNLFDLDELPEAVVEKDLLKIDYLVTHGVSIDYKSKASASALGIAIQEKLSDMIYILLSKYGANPNALAHDTRSALDWALFWRNTDAIIMLLAFGADSTPKFLQALSARFSPIEVMAIKHHAVQLNKRILHIDNERHPEYARNVKLQVQLGLMQASFALPGQNAKQLSKAIDSIVATILAKPKHSRTENDLAQIAIILQQLKELRKTGHTSSPHKLYIARKAGNAIQQIADYLRSTAASLLVFSPIQRSELTELSFDNDVKPLLSLRM